MSFINYKSICTTHVSPFLWLSLILFISTACSNVTSSDEEDHEDSELYQLGEFTEGGYTVTAYSNAPLTVGFHEIYLDVEENGIPADDIHLHFNTLMPMESHSHASPTGDPDQNRDHEQNLYKSWAIFTMAGDWELEITVHTGEHGGQDQNELIISGSIDIDVDAENSNRVQIFTENDDNRYILTWIEPQKPETGINDLVVSLHQSESAMEYPAVINADIEFEPWMPSMDHGSNNNVNPEHQGSGFYQGEVNFNMTGDWELRFEISRNGNTIGSPVIELQF